MSAARFSLMVARPEPTDDVSRVAVWLPDADATGVLAALLAAGVDLPTAEFARLLSGEEVERGGYSLSVRNALDA